MVVIRPQLDGIAAEALRGGGFSHRHNSQINRVGGAVRLAHPRANDRRNSPKEPRKFPLASKGRLIGSRIPVAGHRPGLKVMRVLTVCFPPYFFLSPAPAYPR
jgi:hypothetical protein